MEEVHIRNIVQVAPTGFSAMQSQKTPSIFSSWAYAALTEKEVRYVVNNSVVGHGSDPITIYAKTYGAQKDHAKNSERAYREAYCLGLSNLVFNMLYEQYTAHHAALGMTSIAPALYMFPLKLPITPEQQEGHMHETIDTWTLPSSYIYIRIKEMQRIAVGLSDIQIGLASFVLQDNFANEEENHLAKELREKYCWFTATQAQDILDKWYVSNDELLKQHMQGRI